MLIPYSNPNVQLPTGGFQWQPPVASGPPYIQGTVQVNGAKVIGSGTQWVRTDAQGNTTNAFSASAQIGFGSNDPNQIFTWYGIKSIINENELDLTKESAINYPAGTRYVVREQRVGGNGPFPRSFLLGCIERGRFRNDLPALAPDSTLNDNNYVYTDFVGTVTEGNKNLPVYAAFRIQARPGLKNVPNIPNNTGFGFTSKDLDGKPVLEYSMKVTNQNFKPMSAITIDYRLELDFASPIDISQTKKSDGSFLFSEEDQIKIRDYQKNQSGNPPTIDWNAYGIIGVYGDNNKLYGDLPLTYGFPQNRRNLSRLLNQFSEPGKTLTTAQKNEPTNYKIQSKIVLKSIYDLPLKMTISKVMLFNIDGSSDRHPNVNESQLNCQVLGYALRLEFDYSPGPTAPFFNPWRNRTPNVHMKIYNPEDKHNTRGLAHSIYLNFSVVAIPIIGINPMDFSLLGLLTNIAIGPTLYFCAFIGPAPSRFMQSYALMPNVTKTANGRLVPLDYAFIAPDTTTLYLEKTTSENNTAAPGFDNWDKLPESEISPLGATDLEPHAGPFVGKFMYADIDSATDRDWYRVIQVNQNGKLTYSQPFKSSAWTEQSVLRMNESQSLTEVRRTKPQYIDRRAYDYLYDNPEDVLSDDVLPLAVFKVETENPLADSVEFAKGEFQAALKSYMLDTDNSLTVNFVVRMWFQPSTKPLDTSNTRELYRYRNISELYFQEYIQGDNQRGTALMMGKPKFLSQLIVTPPVTSNKELIVTSRYIDQYYEKRNTDLLVGSLLQVSDSLRGNGFMRFPFRDNGNPSYADLVVAIYPIATPQGDYTIEDLREKTNSPFFSLMIDPLDDPTRYPKVETTISRVRSNTDIYAQRTGIYDATYFEPAAPGVLVVQDKDEILKTGTFPIYRNVFTPAGYGVNDPYYNPFNKLLTLSKDSEKSSFVIPYSTVGVSASPTPTAIADFVTELSGMSSGKVGIGTWSFSVDLDRDYDVDVVIDVDVRLQGMMVSANGRISQYVFITPSKKFDGSRLTFEVTINFPFILNTDDQQFVLRIIANPYWKDPNVKPSLQEIRQKLGTKPFGLRVNKIEMKTNTLQKIVISDVDSRYGSKAFYEDLAMQPTGLLGNAGFFWVADDDATKVVIVDRQSNTPYWRIGGVLYSPTYFMNLGRGVEVKHAAFGFRNTRGLPFFRTVLGAQPAQESGVSAVQDPITGRIHVAQAVASTEQSKSSSANRLYMGSNISQYTNSSPFEGASRIGKVGGLLYSDTEDTFTEDYLQGTNPTFLFFRNGDNTKHGAYLGLLTEADEGSSPIANVSMNIHRGGEISRWQGPQDYPDDNFGSLRKLASGLLLPTWAQAKNRSVVYVVGFLNGYLTAKCASVYRATGDGTVAHAETLIVDGAIPIQRLDPLPGEVLVYPTTGYNGTVVPSLCGASVDANGGLWCAYMLEGQRGKLYVRRMVGHGQFAGAYPIVNLGAWQNDLEQFITPVNTTGMDIFCPVLAHQEATNVMVCAFWCAGRIFLVKVPQYSTAQGVMLPVIHLVAGSGDFDNTINNPNNQFKKLKKQGYLLDLRDPSDASEKHSAIPRQRVGLIFSNKAPHGHAILVYYKDAVGNLFCRHVDLGGNVSKRATIN
jgi:hypothetical protein